MNKAPGGSRRKVEKAEIGKNKREKGARVKEIDTRRERD